MSILYIIALTVFTLWIRHLHTTRQIITNNDDPYLVRYFIWKPKDKSRGRIYLHHILRSDHDRALHDHPWNFTSTILIGGYWEVTDARGTWDKRVWYSSSLKNFTDEYNDDWMHALPDGQLFRRFQAGDILTRRAGWRHRLVLPKGRTAWTLVRTSPKVREWGFHLESGFCHHSKYNTLTELCEEE